MIKKILEMYRALPIPTRATAWFVVCSAVQNGTKFLSMPILTHLMTIEQYGVYNVFLSSINIVTIIATLFLHEAVFNNAMFKYPDDRSGFVSSAQNLSFTVTVICAIIYFPLRRFFNELFGLPTEYMLMIFAQLLFIEVFLMWSAKQRYEYKYMRLVVATTAYSLLYVGLPVAVALVLPQESVLQGAICVGTVVQFVFCLAFSYIISLKARGILTRNTGNMLSVLIFRLCRIFYRLHFWALPIG